MNVGIGFRNFFKHSIPNTFDLCSICPPAYRKRTILTGTIIRVGGPRGSIEIAKCAIFRTNCATPAQRHKLEREPANLICAALVWNFRRWAIVRRLYLRASLTVQGVDISIYNLRHAYTVEE